MLGEAVEVQAVIPVRTADERKPVRPPVLRREAERAGQMFKESRSGGQIVVVRNHLVQNRCVTGLAQIRGCSRDEPQWIIVEAGADVCISLLCERLVLMVRGAVLKLRGCDVYDSLTRPLRDQVDKAEEILTAVPESHAAADARLEIRCGPRHVERDHALILVPDVDHAVDFVVLCLDMEGVKEMGPVRTQLRKCTLHIFICLIFREEFLCWIFVDDARCLPLLILGILTVAEHKHEGLRLAGLERDMEFVGRDRVPSTCD